MLSWGTSEVQVDQISACSQMSSLDQQLKWSSTQVSALFVSSFCIISGFTSFSSFLSKNSGCLNSNRSTLRQIASKNRKKSTLNLSNIFGAAVLTQ